MIERSFAVRDNAMPVPRAQAARPEPSTASRSGGSHGELRPPLALWIYVARGVGRIILSVLALPFV